MFSGELLWALWPDHLVISISGLMIGRDSWFLGEDDREFGLVTLILFVYFKVKSMKIHIHREGNRFLIGTSNFCSSVFIFHP